MGRLVVFATLVLLLVLVVLTPVWGDLGRFAVAPILVAVLHGLTMMGLAQWTLAGGWGAKGGPVSR